jgi:hypothetical protein
MSISKPFARPRALDKLLERSLLNSKNTLADAHAASKPMPTSYNWALFGPWPMRTAHKKLAVQRPLDTSIRVSSEKKF